MTTSSNGNQASCSASELCAADGLWGSMARSAMIRDRERAIHGKDIRHPRCMIVDLEELVSKHVVLDNAEFHNTYLVRLCVAQHNNDLDLTVSR